MKIVNIELTRERLVIVISSAALITALLIYLVFYAPLIRQIRKKYSECKSIESQLFQACNIIEFAEKTHKGRALLTEIDSTQALDELTKHCRLAGVSVLSMKPQEITSVEGSQYKILPIQMETESTDKKFAVFIGSLDELKKCLIKVRSLELVADKADRARINANLVLDMYLANAE